MIEYGEKADFVLFLPFYPTEASGQLGSHLFMMGNAGTAMTMPRAVLGTGTVYVVVWARHISRFF